MKTRLVVVVLNLKVGVMFELMKKNKKMGYYGVLRKVIGCQLRIAFNYWV
jgi:hypothetical protein